MRPKVGSPWARAVLGSRNSASSAARRSTRASRRGRLRPLCSCCVSRFVCLSSQASCTSTRRCSTCPTNQKGHRNDCRRLGAARKSRLQRLHSQGSIPFGLVPLPHPPDLRRTPPPQRADLAVVGRVAPRDVLDLVLGEGDDVGELLVPAGFVHQRRVAGRLAGVAVQPAAGALRIHLKQKIKVCSPCHFFFFFQIPFRFCIDFLSIVTTSYSLSGS